MRLIRVRRTSLDGDYRRGGLPPVHHVTSLEVSVILRERLLWGSLTAKRKGAVKFEQLPPPHQKIQCMMAFMLLPSWH